jgi:hypothetical protein
MIDEKQVREADAAVTQAVTTFVSEFESMWGEMGKRRPRVRHREHAAGLLAADIKTVAGPATTTLAAYRDSELATAVAATSG